MKRFLAGILFVTLTLGLFGCGSDNPGSSGQLAPPTVTLPPTSTGTSVYAFTVTTTYTLPPLPTTTSTPINAIPSTDASGVPVTFTASIYSASGVLQNTIVDTVPTNAAGLVTDSYVIQQQAQPLTVVVTVSTGGLSQTTQVTVPSL